MDRSLIGLDLDCHPDKKLPNMGNIREIRTGKIPQGTPQNVQSIRDLCP